MFGDDVTIEDIIWMGDQPLLKDRAIKAGITETLSSDKIEGVAGTGIGLTIARELARMHGGDLKLVDSNSGCRFRVELHTPTARKDQA